MVDGMAEVDKLIAENDARLETINKLKALNAAHIVELEKAIKSESAVEFCKDLDITRLSLRYLDDVKYLLALFQEQFEVITLYRDKILKAAGYGINTTGFKTDIDKSNMTEAQVDEFKEQVLMKIEAWMMAKKSTPAIAQIKYMNIFKLVKEPFKAEKKKVVDIIVKENKISTPKEADQEYEEEIDIEEPEE